MEIKKEICILSRGRKFKTITFRGDVDGRCIRTGFKITMINIFKNLAECRHAETDEEFQQRD